MRSPDLPTGSPEPPGDDATHAEPGTTRPDTDATQPLPDTDATRPLPGATPPPPEPSTSAHGDTGDAEDERRAAGAGAGAHAPGGQAPPPGGQTPPPGWQPPPPGWQPPPPGGSAGAWGPPPPPSSGFFDSMRRTGIWRGADRWIGGVAAGVARRLDVDPLLIRGLFVVISLFGGLGLLLYGVAWALLPEESDGRIHLQEATRGNVDAALAGALAMTVVGLARPGMWWDGWWFVNDGFAFSVLVLGVIAVVVLGIVAVARRRPTATATAPGPGWSPGTPGTPPATGAAAPPTGPPPAPGGAHPSAHAAAGQQAPAFSGGPAVRAAAPQTAPAPPPWAGVGGPTPPPHRAAPPPAYRAPVPPRPVTPGPGHVTVAVVLALCLLAVAGVLLWDRTEPLGWLLPLTLGGVVLTLLGLGVMLAGFRGRRGGTLSVLGVLLALLVAPATVATSAAPADLGLSSSARIGDRTVTPTTVAQATDGYELLAGDLDLDLTEVPLGAGALTVPVDIGAGDVHVTVPADSPVEVQVELAAGQVRSLTQPGWTGSGTAVTGTPTGDGRTRVTWANGTGITTTLRSPDAADDDPDVVVVVRAGAGSVLIEEES